MDHDRLGRGGRCTDRERTARAIRRDALGGLGDVCDCGGKARGDFYSSGRFFAERAVRNIRDSGGVHSDGVLFRARCMAGP